MARQHKQPREPRTLAQQLSPPSAEVVCDLCSATTTEPNISGRWATCPACTRRLRALDIKSKEAA